MKIKKSIKTSSMLLLVLIGFIQPIKAQKGTNKADKQTIAWRYELESVATGIQGTDQVKVWSYSKNVETATEQAKKNAVHGIIFKGLPNNGRVKGQKPLARNANLNEENEEFFEEFFESDGGDYMKFVTLVNHGQIAPGDRIKISKKEYKIGVVVSVNTAELRKYLESNGIIKGLSNGF
ncbi:hypothetical protein [Bizionia arctica]|uniref:Uncharacterized protein n=1 Tax=Bizionia arctica TaxID=1495645 RepID=A0A917GNP5_9FLAO|nr:hypothetical protein [Bizionia arctica]GGG52365.1 hypothetical protein GCM10010976_24390 [Bizionia arctica]